MVPVQCEVCKRRTEVHPSRAKTYRFCSYKCRGVWRSVHFRGSNNPKWREAIRTKVCGHCGKQFSLQPNNTIATFERQKFCSKPCADEGGFRYRGEQHHNYKPDARRRSRRGRQGWWVRKVLSRDNATCQKCGAKDVELHAHHIKSYSEYPELRWEVANGITLCFRCHWAIHSASNENRVNSGDSLPAGAEANPEPSHDRNIVEGVTTRGRPFRKWVGNCALCGTVVVKRASDVKNPERTFCSRSHASKFIQTHRKRQ